MWYQDKTGIWHSSKQCPKLMNSGLEKMSQTPGWKRCNCTSAFSDPGRIASPTSGQHTMPSQTKVKVTS